MWLHKSELNAGKHHNVKLQNAWNKYGGDTFTFEVLWAGTCDQDTLNLKEIEYIKAYDSYLNGYNMNSGGEGNSGSSFSEEKIFPEKQCQECGASFLDYHPARLGKFCSYNCRHAYRMHSNKRSVRGDIKSAICEVCHNTFQYDAGWRPSYTCSAKCRRERSLALKKQYRIAHSTKASASLEVEMK